MGALARGVVEHAVINTRVASEKPVIGRDPRDEELFIGAIYDCLASGAQEGL
jgi:hypothetical protein